MNKSDRDVDSDISTARTPEDSDAIMSIRIVDFVAANSHNVVDDTISRFLF